MAFCRVVFPLLVLSIVSCSASFVPVYIWGDLAKYSGPLDSVSQLSSSEFRQILKHEVSADTDTVVFVEDTLSVEDFSLKNSDGESIFSYLHSTVADAIYLSSVSNTLKAIDQIADPSETDHIKLTENGLSEEISPNSDGKGRFVVIRLVDAREGESRAEMLERHDQFIQETVTKMQKENAKVVAVYTAEYPSYTIPKTYSRTRRAAEANPMTYGVSGLRLYAASIELKDGNTTTPLSVLSATSSEFNGTTQNTTLTFDTTSLVLNFNKKGGYWFFDSVTLNVGAVSEELHPNDEVFAILDFSYRCQQHISFSTVNETRAYTLSFNDLKIQPFFTETNTTQQFGDSFNCVGFFSAPIWAGLLVVFILLLITFYGIMMMLDIRTMDRFDDPKGKTITINSE